jgi:cytochrome c peroxidase
MTTRYFPAIKHTRTVAALLVAAIVVLSSGTAAAGDDTEGTFFGLWDPFAPVENPVTEERRVLGKILFWDEQLSSDNTMSCGTCHITEAAGVDPRVGVNPSFDGIFATVDDVMGSPGVIATDANGEYLRSESFDLEPQVTGRRSMSNFISMYAGNLFWDGRAEGSYIDPLSGDTLSVSSAALEIQSLMPILNDVEMSHQGREWAAVTSKLETVKPLALASQIPQDMLDALAANGTYPELFEQAFGDPAVTPARIGYAIANYERTLVPNQSPWDVWVDGDPNGMSTKQLAGWERYRNSTCNDCHVSPLFTTMAFAVDGVRPVEEDRGRQDVTGVSFERGAFRMSSLRNLGIRDRFMHTGGLSTLDDVFDFYGHRNGQLPFSDNLDFRLFSPILFTPEDEELVKHFINTALTDPRLAAQTFPFDRPTLHTELGTPNPMISESGNAGAGGFIPQMIAVTPPNIGNNEFKIGLDFALGGAQAWVAVSTSPPSGGVVAQDELLGPIALNGMGSGDGFGTLIYPLDDPAMDGQTFYMQWIVADASAAGGFARSQVAEVTPFCSMIASCAPACPADLTDDGTLNFFDVSAFLAAFSAMEPAADFDENGSFDFFDVSAFLNAFAAGCP